MNTQNVNVPFALGPKIDMEMDCLFTQGVIELIPHTNEVIPIVPVLKYSGDAYTCGNYQRVVNKVGTQARSMSRT